MRFFSTDIGMMTTAIVAAFLFAGIVVAMMSCTNNATSLPSDLGQIEQLRFDASHVDPVQAEDVIGQVTEWNQRIRQTQILNHQWWAGWAIPDEWDSVQLIEVPQ